MLFFDWNENLQYGARYQIGHYIGEVSPVTENARMAQPNLVCQPTYIDWYERTCVGDVCTEWQYTHTDISFNCFATPGGTVTTGTPTGNPGEPTGIGGTGNTGTQAVQYNFGGQGAPVINSIQSYLRCFGSN